VVLWEVMVESHVVLLLIELTMARPRPLNRQH
jgi:hypothetical protein